MSKPWSEDVLHFWFSELTFEEWFRSSPELDNRISERFGKLLEQLSAEPPDGTTLGAKELLATIIVLDQFSRNIHRGKAGAFAADPIAQKLCKQAIERGLHTGFNEDWRQFMLMPLMHAENLADQELGVKLFGEFEKENGDAYAIDHRDVVARFGRFPHRNACLGRKNTHEEEEYLKTAERYGQLEPLARWLVDADIQAGGLKALLPHWRPLLAGPLGGGKTT